MLFVDDEEKARKYFALAMASDFNVRTAGSAAEALDILGQHAGQIAIIVSDQRMPGKSGVELLKTVREYYPHIVRLLTTAYTDLDDAIEAINRGEILRYIQKPWDINTLKAELKQAMNYFQLRNERDSLLEEKLSVRQRMVQIDRITQLLLIAEAMPSLRFAAHAVRRYLELVTNTSLASGASAPADSPYLDLWSQTLAESARMLHFIKTINAELGGHLPARTEFNTQLDFPALHSLLQESARESAATLQIPMAGNPQHPAPGFNVDRPLFRLMLVKLFAIIQSLGGNNQTVTARISTEAAGSDPATALHMSFEFAAMDFSPLQEILTSPVTREIPPPCSDLFVAFLACLHHGGSLEIHAKPRSSEIVLRLPTNPLPASLAAEKPNWHEDILATFEPDIY